MHILRFVFYCIFAISLTRMTYADSPPIFNADYSGVFGGYSATSKRTLKPDNNTSRYRFRSKVKNTFATIDEISTFELSQNRIHAKNYSYSRKVFGFRSSQNIHFDWENNIARYTRKEKPKKNRSYDIPNHTLDSSLYQLQLQADAFNGKSEFHYTFAKKGKVKTLHFRFKEHSEYVLDNKIYKATVLERYQHSDSKKTIVVILPELMCQIAEIVHTEESGKQFIIRLENFEYDKDRLTRFYSEASTHE
jgi:hypothetical protein